MSQSFEGFSFDSFWEDSKYATKEYVGSPVTSFMVKAIEQKIGYKLPQSYITLLQSQNGGIPYNTNFPSSEPTSWAEDHIAITGIFGIDSSKTYSLLGSLGSEFMKSEWGYPDIGVYICDCPSGGHDMIALDYSKCGKTGEPEVVHVDQELDYKITFLSPNFEKFIIGLVQDDFFDISVSEDVKFLWKPNEISFELKQASPLLNTGLMLELNQNLAEGETGWSQSRLNVPDSWSSASMMLKQERIQISINNKKYYIDKKNKGTLSFELLSADEGSDEELEQIWEKFARET
jgi:hypothetical protein